MVTTTLLTNINVAKTALQDIPMVTRITHFAPKASPLLSKIDTLEAARVLALMLVLKLCENFPD